MKKFGIISLFCGAFGFSQQISFQPPIALPTLNGPVAMISADFNGDGTADLAISDAGSHVISISLGKGDGTFQTAATYSVPSGCAAASLAAADFNNDHKLDLLAICQFTTELLVYPGHGDGTFGTPVSTQLPLAAFAGTLFLEAGSAGVGGTVADFNGDGKLDLVLLLASDLSANFSALINIYFLPGNGDGSDVITQSLNIDLGNGDGTFRNGPSYLWTGATFALTAVDVNGDGFVDLVSAGTSLASISGSVPPSIATVMLGDGKGNFRQSFKSTDSVKIGRTSG